MSTRAVFVPTADETRALSQITGDSVFVASKEAPRAERVDIKKVDGGYVSVYWDYSDVEPRFEVFHLSVHQHVELPTVPNYELKIPPYDGIALGRRCEWVRRVESAQIGQGDMYVEEVGQSKDVPSSATAIATYIYALLFMRFGKPIFAVHVSETVLDSLALASTDEDLARIVACCDIENVERDS